MDKKFAFNNELAVFENMNECAQKIKYYLDNLDARDTITLNGYHRAILNYTYVNILQDIIQQCDHLEKKVPVVSIDFIDIKKQHSSHFGLSALKILLCAVGRLFFGKERGKRFARRLVYEMSWRVFKENTFKAKGIVGRMFYSE